MMNIMAENGNESNYRVIPKDKHTLLLLEPVPEQRTFRDYPNLKTCFADIDAMYSDHLKLMNLPTDKHDLEELFRWLDGFHHIEIMVYDMEIARYKSISPDKLKPIFIEAIKEASNETSNGATSETMDEDSDAGKSDWDEE